MQQRKDLATSLATISMDDPEIRGFVNENRQITPKVGSVSEHRGPSQEMPRRSTPHDAEYAGKRIGLIPVTIRLDPELATALKFEALQRQMSGAKVNTQQRIVSEAIEMWLAANPAPRNFSK